MRKSKQIILTTLLCAVLSFTSIGVGFAQSKEGSQSEVIQVTTKQDLKDNVEDTSKETKKQENNELIQDALKAYEETFTAVDALDKNDNQAALDALERAVGKLNIVLGRRPELALIPIQSKVETMDIISDLPTIEIKRAEVEFLVKQGHLQAARKLLDTLASEIRITTANLPMETYPVAIRGIARLIEEDKIDEAKLALQQLLSTVIVFERSMPIPIINCQFLLAEAQKITEEATPQELSQEQKDKALNHLKKAKVQLEVAEELGYGRRNREFKEIRDDIKEIEKKIKESVKTNNLFNNLKERLNVFRNKVSG